MAQILTPAASFDYTPELHGTKVALRRDVDGSLAGEVDLADFPLETQYGLRELLPERPAPEPAPVERLPSFEDGTFRGFNLQGPNDIQPTLQTATVREGTRAARCRLTGSQSRCELALGGDGSGDSRGTIVMREGEEHRLRWSMLIEEMVYGRPGAHNLVMQLKGNDTGSPALGLQLWDVNGKRGLWSHSSAMGGDRLLIPGFAHRVWHDLELEVKVSARGQGYYRLTVDGEQVDARTGVSTIPAGKVHGYFKLGPYRNGTVLRGTSSVLIDAVKLD